MDKIFLSKKNARSHLMWLGIALLGVSVFIGCSSITDSNDTLYMPGKIFCDSTYIRGKNVYKIGERIYVIAIEPTMVGPGYPDTLPKPVKILINSSLGDTETISVASIIPTAGMTRVYSGCINSKGSLFSNNENNILEVSPLGDSIFASYTYVSDKVVVDTALVLP